VSGLIIEGAPEEAERTVLSLARMLRRSLDINPAPFRTLSEEFGAQMDFLDVQHARFGDRFQLITNISDDAGHCIVPSLILQPLIENVFTHGVAYAETPVKLEVSAHVKGDRLVLSIADDAKPIGPGTQTSGTGLHNVAQRLSMLYCGEASLAHGSIAGGGYSATLSLPART
jgi:LytS/YehU family sensor histidine kinase